MQENSRLCIAEGNYRTGVVSLPPKLHMKITRPRNRGNRLSRGAPASRWSMLDKSTKRFRAFFWAIACPNNAPASQRWRGWFCSRRCHFKDSFRPARRMHLASAQSTKPSWVIWLAPDLPELGSSGNPSSGIFTCLRASPPLMLHLDSVLSRQTSSCFPMVVFVKMPARKHGGVSRGHIVALPARSARSLSLAPFPGTFAPSLLALRGALA